MRARRREHELSASGSLGAHEHGPCTSQKAINVAEFQNMLLLSPLRFSAKVLSMPYCIDQERRKCHRYLQQAECRF